jgi:hypothetical protein
MLFWRYPSLLYASRRIGSRWIVKFYYAPGKQTTKTLEPKSQISLRQAEMMREELVRPLNPARPQGLQQSGVAQLVQLGQTLTAWPPRLP